MDFQINSTPTGMKKNPMHSHKNYEIMHYLEGNGYLATVNKNIPFAPGTIIIVPPELPHGSVAENGFVNISIGGNFDHLLFADKPVVLYDNTQREGSSLAQIIYNNRYGDNNFLSSLCTSYIYFLLQNIQIENGIHTSVKEIINEISEHAFEHSIDLQKILSQSGYAEDYIRSYFKKITGKTPTEFLVDIRIKRACYLIDIYKDSLSLSEIATQCGYVDYIYFSKKFKSVTGISPSRYQKL